MLESKGEMKMNEVVKTKQPRCGVGGRSAEQFRFKVVINNAGEILTFYTVATSEGTAKRNALTQLAKKLGHHPASTITRLWDRAVVGLAGG
jgi:hypothetical protein